MEAEAGTFRGWWGRPGRPSSPGSESTTRRLLRRRRHATSQSAVSMMTSSGHTLRCTAQPCMQVRPRFFSLIAVSTSSSSFENGFSDKIGVRLSLHLASFWQRTTQQRAGQLCDACRQARELMCIQGTEACCCRQPLADGCQDVQLVIA